MLPGAQAAAALVGSSNPEQWQLLLPCSRAAGTHLGNLALFCKTGSLLGRGQGELPGILPTWT